MTNQFNIASIKFLWR